MTYLLGILAAGLFFNSVSIVILCWRVSKLEKWNGLRGNKMRQECIACTKNKEIFCFKCKCKRREKARQRYDRITRITPMCSLYNPDISWEKNIKKLAGWGY